MLGLLGKHVSQNTASFILLSLLNRLEMSGHLVLLDVGEHGLKRLHPRLKKDDSLSGLSETNAISLLDIYP